MLQITGSDRKLVSGPVFDRGFSSREARRRAFVACSTGWAGFTLKPDPEEDGDEAAQSLAGANEARVKEADLRVSTRRSREDSLEAMELLGIEIADPMSLPSSDEDEADEESDGWPDEDEHPRGAYMVLRDGQFLTVTEDQHDEGRWSALARAWHRRREDVMETVVLHLIAAVGRHAERRAKAVEGTVVRHADYGIFVKSGRDLGLVHVDTIRGYGSRARALAFLHGNAVGSKVRVIPGAYREAKRRYDLELL